MNSSQPLFLSVLYHLIICIVPHVLSSNNVSTLVGATATMSSVRQWYPPFQNPRSITVQSHNTHDSKAIIQNTVCFCSLSMADELEQIFVYLLFSALLSPRSDSHHRECDRGDGGGG